MSSASAAPLPLPLRIARLALPLLIGNLAVMANSVIDTVMAGRLSAEDLAGVGLGASVYLSVNICLMGVLIALSPIVAQHYGAQRYREIGADTRQALLLALALAIAGAWLIGPRADLWLRPARPPPEVAGIAQAYLSASALGLPGALVFRVFYALNNAIARPQVLMMVNLIGLALKVPLNALFIYGAGPLQPMGGAGCGVSSAVIAWTSAAIAIGLLGFDRRYRPFALRGSWRPDLARLTQLMRLGVPIGLAYLIEITSFTAITIAVARFGAVTGASQQIAASLVGVAYMFALALANATSTLTGHAIGAGHPRLARRTALTGLLLSGSVALALALSLLLLRDSIAALYTADPGVARAAAQLMSWVALYLIFDALQTTASMVLRAYKVTVVPTLIYAVSLWGVGVGVGWWLAFVVQPQQLSATESFWIAGALSVALAAGALGWLLRRVT